MARYTSRLKIYLLSKNCRFERQGKGDHEIWYSPINGKRFPIDHDIRSRHLANKVVREAGIDEKPF